MVNLRGWLLVLMLVFPWIAVADTGATPQGNFDGANCSVSTGWTCDADDFNQALDVHFYADEVLVGSTRADQVREPAVGALCGGNSAHGFSFSTPATLKDGVAHTLSAYAINIGPAGPNPQLGSPQTITCSSSGATPQGNFDSANCSVSTGWTCDADDFNQALDVHIYADGPAGGGGSFLGSTRADQIREPAVGAICGGNSAHGFANVKMGSSLVFCYPTW